MTAETTRRAVPGPIVRTVVDASGSLGFVSIAREPGGDERQRPGHAGRGRGWCTDGGAHLLALVVLLFGVVTLAAGAGPATGSDRAGRAVSGAGARMSVEKTELVVTYVMLADEERYRARRSYAGLALEPVRRALEGVRLGLKEARVPLRGLGIVPRLEKLVVDATADLPGRLAASLERTGSGIVVLDLPGKTMLHTVSRLGDRDVLFLDARHADDALRGSCVPHLFHTLASHAMRGDALAQLLRARNWTRVIVLEGPGEEDRAFAAAFAASAKKFGLRVVAHERFVLSNDPRQRDSTNVALMTGAGGAAHDVIFVADALGEFARYVPYRTYAARPVVGSEGLVPSSWHRSWERHGAPQLNQRFEKLAGRAMTDADWAGWVAMKSVTAAVVKERNATPAALLAALGSPALTIDLYKGAPGSYRAWSGQLRQPILLHTHNAVIERAPLDGYLHASNTLDTLGLDEPEGGCGA